jgi:dipeptidyl aminopeptidase/acylaminoacyl peptidase
MSGSHQPPTPPLQALLAPRIWRDTSRVEASAEPSELVWSPDKRFAAYTLAEQRGPRDWRDKVATEDTYRESLCCIRAGGREARRLYSSGPVDNRPEADQISVPDVAGWSPDSRRILFWKCRPQCGSCNADGSPLFDMPLTGGAARLLTTPYRRPDGYQDSGMMRKVDKVAFSPDGRLLLLLAGYGRFSWENKRLACLDYARGKRLWITPASLAVQDMSWSKEGRHITFTASPDPRRPRHEEDDYSISVDGTGLQKVKGR